MQGRCCHPQAEVFYAQKGGAEGFSGDRTGGEHGASATAASVPISVEALQIMSQTLLLGIVDVSSKGLMTVEPITASVSLRLSQSQEAVQANA